MGGGTRRKLIAALVLTVLVGAACQPSPGGGGRNHLGAADAALDAPGDDAWLAVSGPCAPGEEGDLVVAEGLGAPCPGDGSDPDPGVPGHVFAVDVPVAHDGGPLDVQVYDAAHCGGSSAAGDTGGHDVTTVFALYGPGAPDGFPLVERAWTGGDPCQPTCDGGGPGAWCTLHAIDAPVPGARYVVTVRTEAGVDPTAADGSNRFGLRVVDPSDPGTCSAHQGEVGHRDDCPAVRANGWVGYALAPEASPAELSVARLTDADAGKVLRLRLWDVDEGSRALRVVGPDGTARVFDWRVVDRSGSDVAPAGAWAGTTDRLDVSGDGPQPGPGRSGSGRYNDRLLELDVPLADDPAQVAGHWRLEVALAEGTTDHLSLRHEVVARHDEVPDLIGSWWSVPQAVEADGTVHLGGISSTGMTKVASVAGDGSVETHDLVALPTDDHNTPALLVAPDLAPLVAVASHSKYPWVSLFRGEVPGDLSTLGGEQQVGWSGTFRSYAHLYRRPGSDTVKLVTRGGALSGWYSARSEDGGATWGPEVRTWPFSYGTSRDGVGTDGRAAWWFATSQNPSSSSNVIHVWQVDQASGEIRDASGQVVSTQNWWAQDGPVRSVEMTEAVPRIVAPERMRLLDVGPDGSLLLATWHDGDDGTVDYHVLDHEGDGTWTPRLTLNGGVPFGYDAARYVGGGRFDTGSGDVVLAREHTATGAPGTWTLERWREDAGAWSTSELYRVDGGRKLARPLVPAGGEGGGTVLVQVLDAYSATSYKHWTSRILVLRDT